MHMARLIIATVCFGAAHGSAATLSPTAGYADDGGAIMMSVEPTLSPIMTTAPAPTHGPGDDGFWDDDDDDDDDSSRNDDDDF